MARTRSQNGRTKNSEQVPDAPHTREMQFSFSRAGVWQYNDTDEKDVAEGLANDSDRAAAIIAGTIIEVRMKAAILSAFRRSPKIEERLFQPSGPMGSFSTKIDMVYMLKLVSRAAYNDLIIIKYIRNAFAHRLDIRDFESQSISDRCRNLKLAETHIGSLEGNEGEMLLSFDPNDIPRLHVLDYEQKITNPRERYLMTAQLVTICFAMVGFSNHSLPLI
jgi:DNA-binding MltR family transcriptional regulator